MARFLIVRIGNALLTLILALLVVFWGVRQLPGDAALMIAGVDPTGTTDVAALRAQMGLDDPFFVQFARYLGQLLRGDLGLTSSSRLPVGDAILRALPATLELALLALILASVVGIIGGLYAAAKRGGPADFTVNVVALLGLSVPNFWLGIVLILVFSVSLGWLPASGYVPMIDSPGENLARMVLPTLVLGSGFAAVTLRQMRASAVEVLDSDYIRTARAHGLSRRAAIRSHGLRNSLIPVVTVISLQLGFLITGAVVTEQIFGIPGFGKLTADAIASRDYAMVQGVVLVIAVVYVLVNLLTDLVYTIVDPRIRVNGGKR